MPYGDPIVRAGTDEAIARGAQLGLSLAGLWTQQEQFNRNAARQERLDERSILQQDRLWEMQREQAAIAAQVRAQKEQEDRDTGEALRLINMESLRSLGGLRKQRAMIAGMAARSAGIDPAMLMGGGSGGADGLDGFGPAGLAGMGGVSGGGAGAGIMEAMGGQRGAIGGPQGRGLSTPPGVALGLHPGMPAGGTGGLGDPDEYAYVSPKLLRMVQTAGLGAQKALYGYLQDEQGVARLAVRVDHLKKLAGVVGVGLEDEGDRALAEVVQRMEDPETIEDVVRGLLRSRQAAQEARLKQEQPGSGLPEEATVAYYEQALLKAVPGMTPDRARGAAQLLAAGKNEAAGLSVRTLGQEDDEAKAERRMGLTVLKSRASMLRDQLTELRRQKEELTKDEWKTLTADEQKQLERINAEMGRVAERYADVVGEYENVAGGGGGAQRRGGADGGDAGKGVLVINGKETTVDAVGGMDRAMDAAARAREEFIRRNKRQPGPRDIEELKSIHNELMRE